MTPHVSIKLLLTQSDERLVRMAAAGHDRAFEAIVDRYRRQLVRYAERFPAAGPSEDVVQAAFVRAWGSLRDGTEVRDLRPWLYRIVHNTALNAAKRQRGIDTELVESEALGVGPEAETEIQDDLRRTLDGIAALPGRQRDALVAVAVDGRAHADVGRELGITEPAVRQLVRRARASVRAVASALTPYPLIAWIAEAGATQAPTIARVGEIVGGAGTGAIVAKLGVVAATTGALVVGAPTVHHAVRHAPKPASSVVANAASASGGTAGAPSTGESSRQAIADVRGTASPTAPAGKSHRHDGARNGAGTFRSSHGRPPGPAGSIQTLGDSRQSGSSEHSGSGDRHRSSGSEHLSVRSEDGGSRHRSERDTSGGATTAGTDHGDEHTGDRTVTTSQDGHTESGTHHSGTESSGSGSSTPEGPEAPKPPETQDGASGASGTP